MMLQMSARQMATSTISSNMRTAVPMPKTPHLTTPSGRMTNRNIIRAKTWISKHRKRNLKTINRGRHHPNGARLTAAKNMRLVPMSPRPKIRSRMTIPVIALDRRETKMTNYETSSKKSNAHAKPGCGVCRITPEAY